MTWKSKTLPDDKLPHDSLVARMLGVTAPEPLPGALTESRFKRLQPLVEGVEIDEKPLPLWRVMLDAGMSAPSPLNVRGAAEIEAVRDFIVPEEPEPWLADSSDSPNSLAITAMYAERQRLRDLLTQQARIARGET